MAGKGKPRPERNLIVGRRLLLTRNAMRMKQYEFAKAAAVSAFSYNQWENGAVYPPVDAAIKLVKAHKLTLDWIYLGKDDCLPGWLIKAITALGEAEEARQADAQQHEVKIVQPRRKKSAA